MSTLLRLKQVELAVKAERDRLIAEEAAVDAAKPATSLASRMEALHEASAPPPQNGRGPRKTNANIQRIMASLNNARS